jgi:ATP-dependent Clp protease, protease subunit
MPAEEGLLEASRRAAMHDRLLERRVIFVGPELTEAVANDVVARLLHLDAESADGDVYLYLNCSGGSLAALAGIYDTMQAIGPDVGTVCVGQATGAGAVILAAGAPGKRLALPNARIWVQHPSHEYHGAPSDISIRAHEILRERKIVQEMLARHTGHSVEAIAEDTRRDLILGAPEALAYGFIDEIVANRALPATPPR